ncbi:GT-D fold domain-containing glycosyltransferase [Priestia megaterium]|uniref:GT-D fold domain-containing protein n=1 Tax=Priestia megaterium TaxID=1404 RepID=UPI002E1C0FD3|nr:GT-D fold domain-containing glycosyltransferase [Priestia megaterium]
MCNNDKHILTSEEWDEIYDIGYMDGQDIKSIAAEGIYRGGEKLISGRLKTNQYLPHNIEDVVKAGIKALEKDIILLKDAREIEIEIKNALKEKKGYSLIRLGDGELLTLAHDILLRSEDIEENPRLNFLSYAGIDIPNHQFRDWLTRNILQASAIGIPTARFPAYQRLFNQLATFHKLPLKNLNLTHSVINYYLNNSTTLYHDLLKNKKVLLIGNRMEEGKEYFKKEGYNSLVASITANGIGSVYSVLEQTKLYDYDVAFVSAGIPANIICVELAKMNKVVLDFGHMIDKSSFTIYFPQ